MFSWVFKKTDMVRGQMIEENTRDHIIILFKSCKKTERRSQKLKTDDGTEQSLIEPIHIYLRSLKDETGDTLNSFSIVSGPGNQRIESYWSKFVVDLVGGNHFFRI